MEKSLGSVSLDSLEINCNEIGSGGGEGWKSFHRPRRHLGARQPFSVSTGSNGRFPFECPGSAIGLQQSDDPNGSRGW